MDFLKEYFDYSVIIKIKKNNLDNVVRQFICDRENAIKLIEYFNSIGIEVVDELLIRRLEIFSIDANRIIKKIDEYNKDVLVQLINEDISAINFL